ncbi:MAG: hypothetical protein A2Z20_04825 [Bdellovibrionales bacterium RBG_16_40_8]|nr:MAG: hypothetical protein A2Z20_04825 [Bdellovibrionales bacterium RBG_16_40_8]
MRTKIRGFNSSHDFLIVTVDFLICDKMGDSISIACQDWANTEVLNAAASKRTNDKKKAR